MFAYRMVLSWLLLAGVLSGSIVAHAEPAADPADAARALHLLGYIGADYPSTVRGGEVVDASEYAEQLEFLGVLQELLATLPAQAGHDQLEQGLQQLHEAIRARQPGDAVAQQARSLAARLAELYEVPQMPSKVPDPSRGAPLYSAHCAACHGATGAGDGPAAAGLQPPPTNLQDVSRLDRMSLYNLFNTLGLGVQGTAMPAFASQLDEQQRWDLASFIAGFSAEQDASGATFDLRTLTGSTPLEVAAAGADVAAFRAQRAQPPVQQRGAQYLIGKTRELLEQSLSAYHAGDREQAYELSITAYLEGFELIENALDNLDGPQRKATEGALMAYRQALQDDAGLEVAERLLEQAVVHLEKDAQLLGSDGVSAWLSFFSSLLILLREGLEAILVLAAILAYLHKTGQREAARSVHAGWLVALVAGLATWALAAYVIDVSGAQREVLEGATALFASGVLLWVGIWMHNRRHAAAWQDYVQNSLVSSAGRLGFAVLAFFAVYRELFEIILFYQTLWLQAGPAGHDMVLAGAATALVLLLGLAWIILRGSRSLPLTTFFSVNAILLCALSVVFAGHGVAALQEAGVLVTRPVSFLRFDWLGIYPDAWSLAAQALVLLAIAVLYGIGSRQAPRPAR